MYKNICSAFQQKKTHRRAKGQASLPRPRKVCDGELSEFGRSLPNSTSTAEHGKRRKKRKVKGLKKFQQSVTAQKMRHQGGRQERKSAGILLRI
jgi:hypothetical protein